MYSSEVHLTRRCQRLEFHSSMIKKEDYGARSLPSRSFVIREVDRCRNSAHLAMKSKKCGSQLAGSDSSQKSSTMMMRSIMSNDCCSALPNLSGPMQRSFGLIVCIPIRSIPDGSNRHHGVNRIYESGG